MLSYKIALQVPPSGCELHQLVHCCTDWSVHPLNTKAVSAWYPNRVGDPPAGLHPLVAEEKHASKDWNAELLSLTTKMG